MKVWRLCSRAHAASDGEGARRAGGRWNQRGTAIVYASATLSLAAQELFVHLDPAEVPKDLVAVSADIPNSVRIKILGAAGLPKNWRQYPAPESLAAIGTAWARSLETAVLEVPSAVIPQERNYLLNPAHTDFVRIRSSRPEPFAFDPRMWKKK
ncbi:MAG TPA: RES family NAD+ phosphorylase [Thermoanaerobaculia bacterium]|nr:RES family NAD+ phosphorylase [Thermoanaerobaculia bacterium]